MMFAHLVMTNVNASFSPFYLEFDDILLSRAKRLRLSDGRLYSPNSVKEGLNSPHNKDREINITFSEQEV